MKYILTLLIAICCISIAKSQINAITETGEEVILYENGTWSYKNFNPDSIVQISTNQTPFEKKETQTFLVKSKSIKAGIYINPSKWSFVKGEPTEDAEYNFTLKDEDLYGLLITERVELPLNTLRNIALENAQAASPDIRIIEEEFRTVNGLKVLMMKLKGTIQGMSFNYLGYYYSDENGSVQLVTFTYENLMKEYEQEAIDFLNGFTLYDS